MGISSVRSIKLFIILFLIISLSYAWYSTDWQYRRNIIVSNSANRDFYNTVIRLNITGDLWTDLHAKSNRDDIRIVSEDDTTVYPHWIYNWSTDPTYIYVKIPYLPANSYIVLWMYYGNPNATNIENVTALLEKACETGTVTATTSWQRVNFYSQFASTPVVVATPGYADTADIVVRFRNVNETGFDIMIEEYPSLNGVHSPETVQWIACEQGYWYFPELKLEIGTVQVDNNPTIVELNDTYVDPVVLTHVMTYNEGEGGHTRVTEVHPDKFTVMIEEETFTAHVPETVGYIVIEEGKTNSELLAYTDANIEVGSFEVFGFNPTATVYFQYAFPNTPVVVAKVNSYENLKTMDTRMVDVQPDYFTVRVETSPAYSDWLWFYEKVGWIAINSTYFKAMRLSYGMSTYVGSEQDYTTYTYYTLIQPTLPKTGDTLTCRIVTDYTYSMCYFKWYVDGNLVKEGNNTLCQIDLESNYTTKDNVITCEGWTDGTPATNITVVIQNTPPTKPTVLEPIDGIYGGEYNIVNITCSGSTDVDNDTIEYEFYAIYSGATHFLGSNTAGYYEWNVTGLPSQINVDLVCEAFDGEDHSGVFNPEGFLVIDNDYPETEPNVTSGWYNHTVTLNFTCTDNTYCAATYYCIDPAPGCIPWIGVNGGVNVTYEGINYIRFYSVDAVENKEPYKEIWIGIDTVKPNVTILTNTSKPYQQPVPLNFTVVENNLYECYYYIDSFSDKIIIDNCQNTTVFLPSASEHTITLCAVDYAGNVGCDTATFKVYTPFAGSSGGGTGGFGPKPVVIYFKIPIKPVTKVSICYNGNCEELKPEYSIAEVKIEPWKIRHVKVKVNVNGAEYNLDLDKYVDIQKGSSLIDVGRVLRIPGRVYAQKGFRIFSIPIFNEIIAWLYNLIKTIFAR